MDPLVSAPDPLLLTGYRARPGVYDEMVGADGEIRPHWRYLAEALGTLGLPALHDRWREARRLLRESGATYNVYGDPQGLERPWQLDPIPALVSSDAGYIETVPPPGKERLAGADASHAWFAVCDPDAGWLNFDPTNDQTVVERHITTAWGREYSDVTPMKGIIFGGGASHTATVAVDVERGPDELRPTARAASSAVKTTSISPIDSPRWERLARPAMARQATVLDHDRQGIGDPTVRPGPRKRSV